MYKKFPVPLDGSKLAEKSLSYTVWLAQKSNAELILLHVYQRKVSYKGHYLQTTAEIIAYRTHKHQNGQPAVRVRTISLTGDPATEILKYIDNDQIDLVTKSTHGHSGVRRWLLGSVADRVVHHSMRPARLVKSFNNGNNEDTEYDRTILTLVDGSELAEQILPNAAYHAGLSGGELVLLSFCEPPEIMPALTYHLIPDQYPPKRPERWEKYVRE
jgi:nucleotide-binding universal stress UspA family protein